jgi:hypothetical protein
MAVVWIVLGIAGAGLCWFLFKGALGFATPPEKSGRALLLQRLKQGGIPPHAIPDQAIDEVVASCFKTAQGVAGFVGNKGKYGAWRANFVDQIEGRSFAPARY